MDKCALRVLLDDGRIYCRHAQVLAAGHIVSVKACTNCHWSDKPCENPRPIEYVPGELPPKPQIGKPPCVHLGALTGEEPRVCCGGDPLPVYECLQFHESVTERKSQAGSKDRLRDCLACESYEAR